MNVLAYQPSMTKLWHACTCTSKAMTDEYCHHYIVDQPKRNIPKLATIFSFIQCILVLLNILLLISDHNYFINVKKKPGSYVNLATVSRFISNFLLYKFFFFFKYSDGFHCLCFRYNRKKWNETGKPIYSS